MLDNSQARNNLASQRDRITQLLTQQTQPQSKLQSGLDIGSAFLSALSSNTGAAGVDQALAQIKEQRQKEFGNKLKGQHDLYNQMQDEVKQGNEDAMAVDKAIKDITGNDINAYQKIASQLHNSPEPIHKNNATFLASKVASQMGYKPLAAESEKLTIQKTKAEINKLNAEAEKNRRLGTNTFVDENGNVVNAGNSKGNLPVKALELQNQGLETIGIAEGINADLKATKQLIDSGKLNLGPITNVQSRVKNFAGKSDEQSRNYASFKANLEKIRNDSLRLNKGTQTEGDAKRAWNELFNNLNDKELVKQRLEEIEKINKRASDLQQLNINQIRKNYGLNPLDVTNYVNRPSSIKQENNNIYNGYLYEIKWEK